jgi:RNA recognition motif-containing protein
VATKNLFVAGYGQATTEQQLRDLFTAHTPITAIILKGTFCFINTNNKDAAVYTRSQLSGTMLNGGVLRINFAKESGRLGTSFDSTYGGGSGGQSRSQPQSHYGR